MALIERLMGEEDEALSGHRIIGAITEVVAGRRTAPQAIAMLGLDSAATAEAIAIYEYIWGEQTDPMTDRLLRAFEVEHVLHLAQARLEGYSTPALVRARLGL